MATQYIARRSAVAPAAAKAVASPFYISTSDSKIHFIPAATGTTEATVGDSATGIAVSNPAGSLGYATGAGGAVTQITSRSTGVTLSKISGTIQTDVTSLAAAAVATFTVTNTLVAIGDVILLSIKSGQTNKETKAYVSAVAAGSFDISIHNQHATTAETTAIIINFAVIKAVSA